MSLLNFKGHFLTFIKHELVSSWLYMFVGGMLGAFFVFILNLYLARTLSYSSYGEYVSLLSLYTLLTIPAGSLTATIVHFATKYFASDETGKASDLYKKMSALWLLVASAITLTIYLAHPLLLDFLHIDNPLLILIIAATIGLSYFGIVNTAFIQSLTRFLYLSFVSLVGSLLRFAVAIPLVVIGFGTVGALWGLFFFPLTMVILGFIPLLFLLKKDNQESRINIKEITGYGVPAAIGLLSLSSFITMDVILVKHFFEPHLAGLYGGLSIVGKVIFYFTAAIPSVMFPIIVKKHTRGENYKNIYFLAVALVLVLSIGSTVFYFLFPKFTINLFLGGREYLEMAPLLGLYGIFITIFNLLSLTVNFFLSIKKVSISYLALLFAGMQIILIYMYHQNFTQVILVSILSSSLLLALLLLYFYKLKNS